MGDENFKSDDKNLPLSTVLGDGDIPVLGVMGNGIAETWEKSLAMLDLKGLWYHRGGNKDKGKVQVDSSMTMIISNPTTAPFWHYGMTCTPKDLFSYQMEILGSTDLWVDPTDKTTKWEYTYSERLQSYPGENGPVNQLDEIVKKAVRVPSTRGLNAITWVPSRDYFHANPPCMQSFWFGLVPIEKPGAEIEIDPETNEIINTEYNLNTNVRFRSRNPMIAAPINLLGEVTVAHHMADQMRERGLNVRVGRLVDQTDSYHVTSRDQEMLKSFLERYREGILRGRDIGDRSMDKDMAYEMLQGARGEALNVTLQQSRKTLEENLPADKVESAFEAEKARVTAIADTVYDINKRMYEQAA